MKIIISPAKRMRDDIAYLEAQSAPIYLKEAKVLLKLLKTLDLEQVKKTLKCSDKIAAQSYHNYHNMNLNKNGVPAILSYDGIQYTYMAPHIFNEEQFDYVQKHVMILSGLYGVLKALDRVVPYRLELDNPLSSDKFKSLYEFWGKKPYQVVSKHDNIILDLASAQYGKIIKKHITAKQQYVKCSFMEQCGNDLKEKGVYVKMARGAMVRYLAENNIEELEKVKEFNELGYMFQPALSNETTYVFTRKTQK